MLKWAMLIPHMIEQGFFSKINLARLQNESPFPKLKKEKHEIGPCLERILIYWSEDEALVWKSLPFTLWLERP